MEKTRAIFGGIDFKISFILGLGLYFILPEYLLMKFMLSVFNIIITVISIIFSLLFAACAILMSSSDDDFINFLNEKGTFDKLLWTFKVTLIALFTCLLYALLLYIWTSYYLELDTKVVWSQHKSILATLIAITSYGLIATVLSINNTILFSRFRSKYLRKKLEERNRT